MKVLLIGQFTGYHGENFILDALRQLGIEAHIFNADDYFKISMLNRIMNKFRETPYYFGLKILNEELLKKARNIKPDFILCIKAIYVKPETIAELKKISKVYSWHFDHIDFPRNFSVHFYKSIPLYDCHFSSNESSAQAIRRYGAKKSIVIPMTIDKNIFHPVEITEAEREKYGADVVFVGNYANEMRAEYCEKLCQDGYDIKIYGNYWDKLGRKSCLVKHRRIEYRHLGPEGMFKVYQASKIALAFVREHNNEMSGLRTWEIPLCKGFMLHIRTKEAENFYKEGEEAEFFSSYEEMKRKIDKYLNDGRSRKRIALAGYKRISESNNFIIDHVKKILEFHTQNKLQ